jgi:hypothetical protein
MWSVAASRARRLRSDRGRALTRGGAVLGEDWDLAREDRAGSASAHAAQAAGAATHSRYQRVLARGRNPRQLADGAHGAARRLDGGGAGACPSREELGEELRLRREPRDPA